MELFFQAQPSQEGSQQADQRDRRGQGGWRGFGAPVDLLHRARLVSLQVKG